MASPDLIDRVKQTSHMVNQMLSFIPAKFYVPKEITDDDGGQYVSKKFKRNPDGKAPKQEVKEASKRAKRKKLDPTQNKTVPDLQKDQKEEEEASEPAAPLQWAAKTTHAASPAELQEKLQQHIAKLQQKRKAAGAPKSAADAKHKRQKVKEDRKKVLQKKAITKVHSKPAKDDDDNDNEIVFNKFDFAKSGEEKPKKKKKAPLAHLMAKAESAKKTIDELKQTDAAKAKAVIEKDLWKKASMKAEGTKIRDDPQLLKKAQKRKEKEKLKTKRDWKAREGDVKKRIREKQDKREKNIQARIDAKKSKNKGKGKKAKRPGFEGGGKAKVGKKGKPSKRPKK